MHLLLKIVAKTLTQKPAVCLLLLLSLPSALSSQTRIVTATIDTAKTGAPISKNIYGQFLEHGGDIVNTGIWSELDKKPGVQVEGQTLGALPATITVRPFSVNIYSYTGAVTGLSREDLNEFNEAVSGLRNHIGSDARFMACGAGADQRSRSCLWRKACGSGAHQDPRHGT
jgi:hypothetical protein